MVAWNTLRVMVWYFKVAQGHGATAVPGVHVRIDEARHQHAPGQIDHLRLAADVEAAPSSLPT